MRTDYKNPKYFMTSKKLSKPQACWVKFFSELNLIIFSTQSRNKEKAETLIC